MDFIDAFKGIQKIEEENDIWSLMVGDAYVWAIIRLRIYETLISPLYKKSLLGLIFFRIRQYRLRDVLVSYVQLRKRTAARAVAFSQPNARQRYRNTYYDLWFDPLAEAQKDFVIFEWPSPNPHFRNNSTSKPRLRYLDYLSVKVDILGFIWSRLRRIDIQIRQTILPGKIMERIISEEVSRYQLFEKEYQRFFRKNPSIRTVYMRVACNPRHIALIVAARKQGIKTIELQHGYNAKYNLDYEYRKKLEKTQDSWPFPDEFHVYTEKIRHEVLRNPNCIYGSGNLMVFNFWKQLKVRFASIPQRETFDRASINEDGRKKHRILISSQDIKSSELIAWVERLLKIKEIQEKYLIIYKLHPREIHNLGAYDCLRARSGCIVVGNEVSIYELFNITDIHPSITSSSVYDAYFWGIPNIIFKTKDSEIFSDIKNEKGVYFASDEPEYISLLHKLVER